MSDKNSSSSSKVTTANMPLPANKNRKRSSVTTIDVPIRISAAAPTNVALPPPLMPYHPHLVPSYYSVYHQHPYFLSVGPQPPISPSLSPILSSSSTPTTNQQRILPKSPQQITSAMAPTFNYFPYQIQVSPQLHPTTQSPTQHPLPGSMSPVLYHPIGAAAIRHNSVSLELKTTTATTADQREQARKVSHSAIERRRRERINDKITQLKDLIPSCADRENLHKMTILQSAIDYITYLKKVIDDLNTDTNAIQQQTKSMLPKEVEPFTHQFSVQKPPMNNTSSSSVAVVETKEKVVAAMEEEDFWSVSSVSSPNNTNKAAVFSVTPFPTSSLRPMDLIKLNKKSSDSSAQENINNKSPTSNSVDRNMNLENLLC